MSTQEIMLYLQQNSYYGSIISMCVVVVLYIIVSVLIIVKARKNEINICAMGMIPVVQLGIPFYVGYKNYKKKKAEMVESKTTVEDDIEIILDDEEEVISEDEEIEF